MVHNTQTITQIMPHFDTPSVKKSQEAAISTHGGKKTMWLSAPGLLREWVLPALKDAACGWLKRV